jgi:hypothetical protein
MSNIKENAFQIARYLLENPENDELADIKKELELSDQDFSIAITFLVDDGHFHTTGQSNTRAIYKKNLARLQDFVDQVSKERIVLSREAEQLLKFLAAKLSPKDPFYPYRPITNHFKWNEPRYMQVAQELQDNGMVEGDYAGGNLFFTISLTPTGRQVIRNNFRNPELRENPIHVEQLVANLSGNNNIVNIGSILTSVTQAIQANANIESSAKQELEALLLRLENELSDIPVKYIDNAEAVAEMAKDLVEKATKEKPNKPLVQISADGFKKAAENIAAITPKVIITAQAIITFIKMQFPSLLP